jgi:tellurite resistance protein TerC
MFNAIVATLPTVGAVALLDAILSVDNAIALASLVTHLPEKVQLERPKRFAKFSYDAYNPQKVALRAGMIGAYAMRGILLLGASWLISHNWVKVVAAVYLVYLTIANLGTTPGDSKEELEKPAARKRGLFMTIVKVEIADLMFSVENIMGSVAYSSKIWAVIAGVFVGIAAMRFVAGLLVRLVQKYPVLGKIGYVLIGSIGVQLLFSGLWRIDLNDYEKFALVVLICGVGALYDRIASVNRCLSPFFHVCAVVMGFCAYACAGAAKVVSTPLLALLHTSRGKLK